MHSDDLFAKLYQTVLHFIAYQDRTENEVAVKLNRILRRWHLEADSEGLEQAAKVMTVLKDDGTISDEKYASEYVASQTNLKRKSPFAIKIFLLKKKVPKKIIDTTLGALSAEYRVESALKLGSKKLKTLQLESPRLQKLKLTQFLARKGFARDTIHTAVDTLLGVK